MRAEAKPTAQADARFTSRGLRFSLCLLALLGCRDKEPPAPRPAPPPTPGDVAGPNAVTVAFGADATALAWGVATYRPAGLEVRLASGKLGCADLDKPAAGTALSFSVPPGPEGKFYVQAPIGVAVGLVHAGKQLAIPVDETTLALEAFTPLVAGAHVKGKLVAATHLDGTNILANGTFDVEVCKPPASPVRALRGEAPRAPVSGRFETTTLAPLAAHAFVATRAERGPYVERLVFYGKADAACDNTTDVLFTVTQFATRKSPTPAEVTLARRDAAAEITFDAWVAFENVAFEPDESIKGSLQAQPAFQWEGKGELGGTFEATVCAR